MDLIPVAARRMPIMREGKRVMVEPGDPVNSYLYQKVINGQAGVGGTGNNMPVTGSLSQSQIDQLQSWISSGAPN